MTISIRDIFNTGKSAEMSFNGSSSYAYNYSNDYYPHLNRPSKEKIKRKPRYQVRRVFEIERQAVIYFIVGMLLFGLIYSLIMHRKLKAIKVEDSSNEETNSLPPMAQSSSQSINQGVNSSMTNTFNSIPMQPNSSQMPFNSNPMMNVQQVPMNNPNSNPFGL